MSTELQRWMDAQPQPTETGELHVPHAVLKAMMAQSVVDNWPRYVQGSDADGGDVVLKFGDASAANKALEMLAKAEGMMDQKVDVSGTIDIRINGVDLEALQ